MFPLEIVCLGEQTGLEQGVSDLMSGKCVPSQVAGAHSQILIQPLGSGICMFNSFSDGAKSQLYHFSSCDFEQDNLSLLIFLIRKMGLVIIVRIK